MREVVAIVLATTACSYQPVRVEPPDDTVDAANTVVADAMVDAFVSSPPTECVAKWIAGVAFTPPTFIQGGGILTQGNERDPYVSKDGLVLYYVAVRNSDLEVLSAVRAQPSGSFTALKIEPTLSDDQVDDGKVTMTDDGLTAFVSTERRVGAGGGFDFWTATRTVGGDAPFGTLTQDKLAMLNDATDQLDPHISPDGRRLYFAAGTPPAAQTIVVSSRGSTNDEFPPATPLANVSDGFAADPTLTADERVIVFTSSRPNGTGATDLWYATRAERNQPFGAPINLPINSTDEDGDPHISPDGCTLYFASHRFDGNDYDLMVASVVP